MTLTGQPRDFHTGAPLTRETIQARKVDDHHVFPRGYLAETVRISMPDSVLNHCLIDRETNVAIGKKAPSVYLEEIRGALGAELDAVLESQMLPAGQRSVLFEDDFDGFLSWRLERLSEVLLELTGAAGWEVDAVDPKLARLDARIESVELRLRQLVLDALNGDEAALPDHIAVRARERVVSAARKQPGASTSTPGLETMIEYFDLRDLQDLIVSKATWARFESTFSGNGKDLLAIRFDQLAELRNAIRHSRSITDITVKDGEAALLWFEQILASQ